MSRQRRAQVPSGDEVVAMLRAALATGTREAFTALLTEDVHWGGERGGRRCRGRAEVGDHYRGLLAAGVTLRITEAHLAPEARGGLDAVLVQLEIRAPDVGDLPSELAVRLTLRDGLVADICSLDPPLIANPTHEAAIAAVQAGDLPALGRLLREHPDLATARLAHHQGRTLLHVATDWPGHYPHVADIITALVGAGADPDAASLGDHAETPLHWAASSGDLEAVNALLDSGADIDAPGAVIAGGTAMADATAFGQWDAARVLLERGASTNLFEAAALGLVARVEAHLATGHPTRDDITSGLWGACHGGHLETVKVLLERGADPSWVGYDDLTPLGAAERAGAADVVDWLRGHTG